MLQFDMFCFCLWSDIYLQMHSTLKSTKSKEQVRY